VDLNNSLVFISGGIAVGYLVAAAFFLRFWFRTRDPLFVAFAGAFALMAINQAIPVIFGIPREEQGGVYLLRFAAFLLIIAAVLRKNLSRHKD